MRIRLDILRRLNAQSQPYWQGFFYEAKSPLSTVATALDELNAEEDLRDTNGNPAASIRWECSCLQKRCGACAMVIDGEPSLACDTLLSKFTKGYVRVEPLRKFPPVADLIVDRSVLAQNLNKLGVWPTERTASSGQAEEIAFESSRCLQCGLCLEVCPNFCAENSFTGISCLGPASRLLAEDPDASHSALAGNYRRYLYEGCGKSLSCANVCPAAIPVERLMVKTNAVAVWKRHFIHRFFSGKRRTDV